MQKGSLRRRRRQKGSKLSNAKFFLYCIMKFPSTIDINVYKAYINTAAATSTMRHGINAIDLHWETTESLKDLCIRILAENWNNQPIFSAVAAFPEDQRQLLDSLDVSTLKLGDLVTHIQADDGFWKRCFIARWPNFVLMHTDGKKWIRVSIVCALICLIERHFNCFSDIFGETFVRNAGKHETRRLYAGKDATANRLVLATH